MTPDVVGIGIVVVMTALIAFAAKLLKQPIIPSYILAGVIIGPIALQWIADPKAIQTLSDLTIIFVMFVIGLVMDVDRIKSVGSVVSFGGIIQVILTSILGFAIACIWFDALTSMYIGLMFAFGSTALVVKILADKRQLDTLHGAITLGILLLQDILAIVALSLFSAKGLSTNDVIGVAIKSFGIVFIGILAGQYVFPKILAKISDSTEQLTLTSIAIGFIFAFLAESQGLSASIGAFITGVSLANLPFRLELQGRVKALRDFFLPIFFATLGVQVAIPGVNMILPVLVLTICCLILKPLLISVIIALFGYQRRTSFFVGVALVPVSEFGLVLVAVGIKLGQIKPEIMTLSILVMALSMFFSSYLFGGKLYQKISPLLQFLDRIGPQKKNEEDLKNDGINFKAILIGCHRAGRYIYHVLCNLYPIKVIEYDLNRLMLLKDMEIPCLYGDATDPEVWESLGDLSELKIVASTISDVEQSLTILRYLKSKWPHLIIILSADHIDEAKRLYEEGADYVICPYVIAGQMIEKGDLNDIFNEIKVADLRDEAKNHIDEMAARWRIKACQCGNKQKKTNAK